MFGCQSKRCVQITFVRLLEPIAIFLLRLSIVFLLLVVKPELLLQLFGGFAIGIGECHRSRSGQGVKEYGELDKIFYPIGIV